jgi:putative hemolysin
MISQFVGRTGGEARSGGGVELVRSGRQASQIGGGGSTSAPGCVTVTESVDRRVARSIYTHAHKHTHTHTHVCIYIRKYMLRAN